MAYVMESTLIDRSGNTKKKEKYRGYKNGKEAEKGSSIEWKKKKKKKTPKPS